MTGIGEQTTLDFAVKDIEEYWMMKRIDSPHLFVQNELSERMQLSLMISATYEKKVIP